MKVVLSVVNAAVVALFLAGYLARYVHPRHAWWLQLVAVLLPYFAALVVVATAGWGWAGRWGLAGGHAALCVLILLRFGITREGAQLVEGTPSISLLTFNANPDRMGPEGRRDLGRLVELERPDVLAVQESPVLFARGGLISHGINAALGAFLHAGGFSTGRPTNLERGRLELPVYSHMDWLDQAQFYLKDEPEERERSAFTRAELRGPSGPFAVYNVHLHSFGQNRPWRGGWIRRLSPGAWVEALRSYREDFLARAAEAKRLRALLEAEPLPFIVCGDFNSSPHNWSYAHLARGLRDAFREGGTGSGFTYHARFPFVRIDYVLASPEWDVIEARVPRRPATDHLPVVAKLALRSERE